MASNVPLRFKNFLLGQKAVELMRRVPFSFTATIVLLFSVTVHAQVLSWGKPEEVGMSSERLARLDEVLREAINKGEVPGAN